MRPFLSQQIYSFSIVTICVFWTLALLSPQTSDAAFNGGWGTFFDFYGKNINFRESNRGDAYQKEDGDLLLIWGQRLYFQMDTGDIPEGQGEIQGHFHEYPKYDNSWPKRRMRKVHRSPKPVIAVHLAWVFAERFFPFHPVHCNKLHYMFYILYGMLKINEVQFKECPLAASWEQTTAEQIISGEFKLMDSNNVKHDFNEYNTQRQPRPKKNGPDFSMAQLKHEACLKWVSSRRRQLNMSYRKVPPEQGTSKS